MSDDVDRGVKNVNWLLSKFVQKTPGVEHAIAVSSDGLLMAISSDLARAAADKLAAIISGMSSLGDGASYVLHKGGVAQHIIDMRDGYFFVSAISGGSALGVVTAHNVDLGMVGFEMTLLVERVGSQLTPELITELKRNVGSALTAS